MMPRRTRRIGLTLMEVLVASALLGIALVPAFDMVTRGMVLAHDVEVRTRAVFLAEREMETALAKATENFSTSLAKPSADLGDGYRTTVTETVSGLKKTITVQAGFDTNKNGVLGSDEVLASFATIVADTTTPGTL
ncbi:MAG TPA: prepilin-type N-terminal cleavage/methylation domain-containing protein [Phycisphaerae bacterium]|nr:prepilin-type N-terminal cleavage/methylation domain-containing protein [Phycisphaerae bacterium]